MRYSLIERSVLTFESYISGPYKDHFFSSAFLDGVCQRKRELNLKIGRASASLIIITSFLAFLDTISGSVVLFSVTIPISGGLSSALSLIVGANLFTVIILFLESFIIDRYVSSIGAKAGMYSFNLYLIDRISDNIWSDPMMPRYFGPKSNKGHGIAQYMIGAAFLILFFCGFVFPLIVILNNFNKIIFSDYSFIELLLSSMSIMLCITCVLIIITYSIKFKFDPADFDEGDGSPTAELLARLENESESKDKEASPTNDTAQD